MQCIWDLANHIGDRVAIYLLYIANNLARAS